MRKVLLIIAAVFALAVAGVLGYATTMPDAYRVERSTTIAAAPDVVFPFINDFHNWSAWSPWEKLDPAMKKTHSGAASGKGAVYAWEGNSDVGKGSMEIIDSTAPSKVTLSLHFMEPFEDTSTTEFSLAPEGAGTKVAWVMSGQSNFMAKVMGVFCSMDSMIGKDFEAGLASMKTSAEQAAAVAPAAAPAAEASSAPEQAPAADQAAPTEQSAPAGK